ncbi:MAG: hypothetical protein WD066_07225 [Planctomycetaceae bacterium]
MKNRALLGSSATLVLLALDLFAVDRAVADPIEPALAPDPAVAKVLDELGDDSLAKLPEAKLVGEFNELARLFRLHERGPGARNFSIKMVWAPERGRALFAGANHGTPHRLNDIWEFDLAANTWVLLHPPNFNASRNQRQHNDEVVLRDGFPATKSTGAPIHVGHTWWQFTYDPEAKAVLWLSQWPGYGRLHERYEHITAEDLYAGPPMWHYLPAERKWQPRKAAGDAAPTIGMGDTLEYVSDLKASYYSRGGWLYHAAEGRWERRPIRGTAPPTETVMVYDSKNKVLVAHRGVPADYRGNVHDPTKRTWHLDFETNTWEEVAASKEIPNGHDAWTPFVYDSVNGVCLLFDTLDRQGSIWAYDAARREWKRMLGSEIPSKTIGYFDSGRNAFVLINDRQPWVYRHTAKKGAD